MNKLIYLILLLLLGCENNVMSEKEIFNKLNAQFSVGMSSSEVELVFEEFHLNYSFTEKEKITKYLLDETVTNNISEYKGRYTAVYIEKDKYPNFGINIIVDVDLTDKVMSYVLQIVRN